MRLLFLAGREPDYLQDALYHGLVTLLGADNVVEYPENARYHGGVPADPSVPMLSFDFPRATTAELRELVTRADAIVIASLRDDVVDDVRRVLELRGATSTAFVDGEDHPYVRGIADQVDVYFKRETLRRSIRLRARMPLRRLYHRRSNPELWADPLRREIAVATARSRAVVPLPFGIVETGFEPTRRARHRRRIPREPDQPGARRGRGRATRARARRRRRAERDGREPPVGGLHAVARPEQDRRQRPRPRL